jgi:hypothetical protein
LFVCHFAAIVGALAVSSLAGSASASDLASCKTSRWSEFRTASGSTFKNQGACVAYVDNGGKLYLPTVLTFTATLQGGWDDGQVSEWGGELIDGDGKVIASLKSRVFSISPVDASGQPATPPWCTGSFDTYGFGSCTYTFTQPGTYDWIATFEGDKDSDPGLLPSWTKGAVTVAPCTTC